MGQQSSTGGSDFAEKWMGIPSKKLMPGNKKDPVTALREVHEMLESIQNSACNNPNRRDPNGEAFLRKRLEYNGDLNFASKIVTSQQLDEIFANDPKYCGKTTGRLLPTYAKKWDEQLKQQLQHK
jgi:hypothetical protein